MIKYCVGIVGSRNSGKTTTTVNLSDVFSTAGYKVAIIKFMHHKFDLDPNHKDSATLRQTKADTIISTSPYETVLFQRASQQADLRTLLNFISDDTDVVFCESYPANFPKIPLIFVCKNTVDYYETKERFRNTPIFITGIIANQNIDTLETTPILSNIAADDLQLQLEIILKQANKSSSVGND